MTSRDLTPLPDLAHELPRAGPAQSRRPIYVDLLPPCNVACPAGENIQAWLSALEAGRHEQAWRGLVADNPLPAIHGRVCYHPCEGACNRSELDSAVSIHAVERFLGDLALERSWSFPAPIVRSGKRVLVVGAGPSGLSAAYHLARRGHEVESVKAAVTIPVADKLSPYLSSIGEMARRLDEAGADGLVLFNRFLHPDLDVESLAVVPGLGLSHPTDGRLPRTWIALLRGRVQASLAASTGVNGPDDLVKYLLAGAEVVMTTSSLLRHGPAHARALLEGLSTWMARKGFSTIGEVRGKLAVAPEEDETARERAAYVAALRAANASTRGPW